MSMIFSNVIAAINNIIAYFFIAIFGAMFIVPFVWIYFFIKSIVKEDK